MKKQMTKMIAAMVLLASGFLANANENEREISLKTEDSKTVVLEMKNVKAGTDISLWSEDGKLLYQDEAKGNSYARVFNLSQWEQGNLTLELENEESLEILPIEVSKSKAELKSNAEITYAKPVLKMSGQAMKVYLSQGHKCYQMSITDANGSQVFQESIAQQQSGMKRYDVSKLSQGKYNIQFTADGRSFYHTIMIK